MYALETVLLITQQIPAPFMKFMTMTKVIWLFAQLLTTSSTYEGKKPSIIKSI